jgi:glycosyltransferase involved in cell wall biosynthesis
LLLASRIAVDERLRKSRQLPESPLRVLELRTVRGTGGGPEKTILLGTARTDPARYAVTVCYIRDERDPIFQVDHRARELPVDYVEVRERHSFDSRIWKQLLQLVAARQIEIVHSHEYKTDLLAWLMGRRCQIVPLATAHGWTGHSARERYVYYPADRRLLARFPHVVAVSSEIRDTLVRAGARPQNVTVVLNAIDPIAFKRDPAKVPAARSQFGMSPDDFVLGAVGRLEPQKNFTGLIAVFAQVAKKMPHARLLIAGDGSLRSNLQRQIDELDLGDRCRLLGQVNDVALLHHTFDLFVQSSVYEGTPNAVLEAMALESSIVATNAGGTAELARDGIEALIVPAGDAAALERALLAAIGDTAQNRQRAVAARRRVETELSFDSRLRRVERIYDDLARRFIRHRVARSDTCSTCATP